MLGNKIKEARLKASLTRASAAELLHVSEMTIWRWESGAVTPSQINIHKLEQLSLDAEQPVTLGTWRARKGLSQTEVGIKVGKAQTVVSQVERGNVLPTELDLWLTTYGVTEEQFRAAWKTARCP